ncbi:hypothetical protein EYF80_012612 [Liparis tanakae]|uniref:Uncharacterized protein n=1 Tax=Liparis tanakae TaxID=230148 RepID=A0A4Z2IIY3_9TELE|nr:hypothetical protein EYF80_012612 [Liparis tanakae]
MQQRERMQVSPSTPDSSAAAAVRSVGGGAVWSGCFLAGSCPNPVVLKRSPLRSNAKGMLRCDPQPITDCYGGMPSHESDLYHTMNASAAVQRGHK